jgi:hypothetical protein
MATRAAAMLAASINIFSRIDIAYSLPYCCLFALYTFKFNLCIILVLSYFCMNILKYVLKVHEYFMCVLS